MPLPLSTSDGEFTPYLKYNAKAGRFYVRPQGATQDVEVMNPRLAFDMEHIKTGWLFYQEGVGPEKVWDQGGKQGPRPPGPQKWKRGFEVMVFGVDDLPDVGRLGLREFSSTASNVIGCILKMYAAYEMDALANPKKVPFYVCKRVIPIQGAYGTNYEPEFILMGWVDRAKVPQFDEHLAGTETPQPAHVGNGATAGFGTPPSGRQPIPATGPDDLNDDIPWK